MRNRARISVASIFITLKAPVAPCQRRQPRRLLPDIASTGVLVPAAPARARRSPTRDVPPWRDWEAVRAETIGISAAVWAAAVPFLLRLVSARGAKLEPGILADPLSISFFVSTSSTARMSHGFSALVLSIYLAHGSLFRTAGVLARYKALWRYRALRIRNYI
jgi:hypothetical protein